MGQNVQQIYYSNKWVNDMYTYKYTVRMYVQVWLLFSLSHSLSLSLKPVIHFFFSYGVGGSPLWSISVYIIICIILRAYIKSFEFRSRLSRYRRRCGWCAFLKKETDFARPLYVYVIFSISQKPWSIVSYCIVLSRPYIIIY